MWLSFPDPPSGPGRRPSRSRIPGTAAAFLALLLLPAAVRAQEGFRESNPDSALAVKLTALEGTPITLDEAFRLTMERSTEIRSAAEALVAAKGSVQREAGNFDPELFARAERSSDDSPAASPFAGANVVKTNQTTAAAGARITLHTGTELEASLNTTRTRTNSTFTTLNPQFDTFGLLTLRQPLLSGFGPSARVELTAAERAREAAQARYNDAVLGVRAQVENTYWDIYAAERNLAVLELIRDQAVALLHEAELRQQAGLVGPNQVANARVFLAQQRLAVLDGEEDLDAQSDRLAVLIGSRPEAGQVRFRPVDSPPHDYPERPVEELVKEAEGSNYQLIAANADLERARARVTAAKWDALPDLDLVGSLGSSGLSGTGQDVIFGADTLHTTTNGGFGQTWAQVRDREFPNWSVGVELTLPLGLRHGRGEKNRLQGEARQAEQVYEATARDLEARVRQAHRELENGARRLEAAQNGVQASQDQVRIGLIEYRNGRTTAFELVRLGADLANAQRRYSDALVRTAKAAAELRHLTSGAYPEGVTP